MIRTPVIATLTLAIFGLTAGSSTVVTAQLTSGTLVSWGLDNQNQVADTPAGDNILAVSASYAHSLALRSDGSLAGWGSNSHGQTNVPSGTGFAAVAAGGYFSLALRTDGSLVGWGPNDFGQTIVPAGNNFVAIAAGGYCSHAIVATTPAPGPTELIETLQDDVLALQLRKGVTVSLMVKLNRALAEVEAQDNLAAIDALNDFLCEVQALSGKVLPVDEADDLIAAALELIDLLS